MVSIRIEGIPQLQAAVRRVSARVQSETAATVTTTTTSVAARMRALAPRDTGNLQRAIATATDGVRIDGADYWRFVEFGTVRMAARPFVRTSAEVERPRLEQRTRDMAAAVERDFSSRSLV